MNRTNFVQTGGFPVKAERLQELQTAYSIFNQLGFLAGNLTIISGCTVVGTNVSDGFVFINGEILEFKGGFLAANVIIIEDQASKEFQNGDVKAVHYTRYATFGTADTSWAWTSFTRVDSLKQIQSRILPPGTNPQLYCGSVANIPQGWFLCDGTNGTPDLKGQFIVGYDPDDADYNAIGKTGGEKKHTLTNNEMPEHDHDTTTTADGGGGINIQSVVDSSNSDERYIPGPKTGKTGGNQAHENRPPYYTLAYIIYKG